MNRFSISLAASVAWLVVLLPAPSRADQVIADDLIVQASFCVGFDCVNNESFGFDTIRLKENNLRIGFDDTSASGFPANDWQLTANDSASGGANKFSIDDVTGAKTPFTIRAGAATNSIFVDSTGRVGLRTATPVLDLHINTTNTPAIRLEQNSSGGFTAQTWDIAGNEANFFVRDVTGGSRLPLRIRPGAPTSSVDISASGNVGIGTASPVTNLHIKGTDNAVASFETSTRRWSAGANVSNDFRIADNTAGQPRLVLTTTGAVQLPSLPSCAAGIVSNASGQLACAVSSARFKHIEGDLTPQKALATVMAFRPKIGTYKDEPAVPEHWLIAEEVAAIDPALAGYKDGVPYTVKTSGVVTNLVAVIQLQEKRIETLERALKDLADDRKSASAP